MSKKRLFQYAVLFHKVTKDKDGKITDTHMVIEPKYMLAASEKEVLFKVTREIPEEYIANPDDVEIIVRNF